MRKVCGPLPALQFGWSNVTVLLALVVINPQQLPSADPADWAADYAHVTSVSGNLTVGRVGEEKKPPGPGLWERMTRRIFY